MHGARNDFIVLDARTEPVDGLAALARRLCDRHTGIGADGLLVIGEGTDGEASMRVINSDGSEAEMCGNGVRCVARYLDEHGEGGEKRIDTGAGAIQTRVIERGETYRVCVDMGLACVLDLAVPLEDAVAVDVGNPHVVLFRETLDAVDLVALGEEMQQSELFPNGTNVHVAVVDDRSHLRVRHYERGAGLTMACGTGAVACVAAGIARGLVDRAATVAVPGGELSIEIDERGRALMTGPAVHVFDTAVDVRIPERV
jgi:diaminopimelate epimerase